MSVSSTTVKMTYGSHKGIVRDQPVSVSLTSGLIAVPSTADSHGSRIRDVYAIRYDTIR